MSHRDALLFAVIYLFLASPVTAVYLEPLNDEGSFVVVENTRTNVLTCSGLTSQDTVTWKRPRTWDDIADCPPSTPGNTTNTCTQYNNFTGFLGSRTSEYSSTLNFDTVAMGSAAEAQIQAASPLFCEVRKNGTVGSPDTSTSSPLNFTTRRPSPPTLTCPVAMVPENSTLTCTCSITNIGTPKGRLVVLTGVSATNITDVIKTGDNGGLTLQMTSEKLVRGDHNVRRFRCDADWEFDVPSNVVIAKVGYPLTQANVTFSPEVVSEGQSVTLTCTGSGGRPADPSVTSLRDNTGQLLTTGTTSAMYNIPKAECHHTGLYACSAGNDMGPIKLGSNMLFVKCQPRSEVSILPPISFGKDPTTSVFDVTAYPVPDDVTFAYLGQTPGGTARPITDIAFKGTCTRGENLYTAQCRVTVIDMSSPSAAGFYAVTVSNSQGSLRFVMEVTYEPDEADQTDQTDQPNGTSTPLIVGVVVGVIVPAVVVIIVVLILMKKRRDRRSTDKNNFVFYDPKSVEVRSPTSYVNRINSQADEGIYATIREEDVGIQSVYDRFGHGNNDYLTPTPPKMTDA